MPIYFKYPNSLLKSMEFGSLPEGYPRALIPVFHHSIWWNINRMSYKIIRLQMGYANSDRLIYFDVTVEELRY
jgi:hypothetical protein